jgi:hypothetical protein
MHDWTVIHDWGSAQMMDWCSRDVTEEEEFQLEGILEHQKKTGTSSLQILID